MKLWPWYQTNVSRHTECRRQTGNREKETILVLCWSVLCKKGTCFAGSMLALLHGSPSPYDVSTPGLASPGLWFHREIASFWCSSCAICIGAISITFYVTMKRYVATPLCIMILAGFCRQQKTHHWALAQESVVGKKSQFVFPPQSKLVGNKCSPSTGLQVSLSGASDLSQRPPVILSLMYVLLSKNDSKIEVSWASNFQVQLWVTWIWPKRNHSHNSNQKSEKYLGKQIYIFCSNILLLKNSFYFCIRKKGTSFGCEDLYILLCGLIRVLPI